MSEDRFYADGSLCTYEDDADEPVELSFDLRTNALPGWYAAPDGSPYPWYWDGQTWVDPELRLDGMLSRFTESVLDDIAARTHRERAGRIARKYYWHLFKNIFTGWKV